jgi:galactoside O-acetyltransferase
MADGGAMSATITSERTKTHAAVTGGGSALRRYQEVIVGRSGLGRLFHFELCLWLGSLPGAVGLALRMRLWPRLFGSCGRGVLFGSGVVLRHPHRIHLGDRVVVGEGCVLDGRHDGPDRSITLADDVILSTGVVLSAKSASIQVGPRSGIGPHSVIVTTDGNAVRVGADVAVGPHSVIVGGGNYYTERFDVPIWRQGIKPGHHVTLGDDIWLGAGVRVLGGSRIDGGSIVAAGAVVNGVLGPGTIAAGVPARVVRMRAHSPAAGEDRMALSSSGEAAMKVAAPT